MIVKNSTEDFQNTTAGAAKNGGSVGLAFSKEGAHDTSIMLRLARFYGDLRFKDRN